MGLRCRVWVFSRCGGFSCCGAQALGTQASAVVARGLSNCGPWALQRRLSSCGARASLPHGMWDLPRPGLELVSPALAGRFLTPEPPGKSLNCKLFFNLSHTKNEKWMASTIKKYVVTGSEVLLPNCVKWTLGHLTLNLPSKTSVKCFTSSKGDRKIDRWF